MRPHLPLLPLLPLVIALASCKMPDPPPVTAPWTDGFERQSLGGDWLATKSDAYKLLDGKLNAKGAYNHPLWLRKRLPRDAVIEFDCWSNSPAGDIKVEAWGDGESHATNKGAYTATSYVFIMGGWHNARSILARMDEHAAGVPTRTEPRVEVGRKYHWKIVRKGGRIEWFVDDMTRPFLALDDPQPLEGKGHEYFGVNNWESDVWLDNLSITPAP